MIDPRWLIAENMVTIVVTGLSIVGLYFAGAGGWSIMALVLLVCMNAGIKIKRD